MYIMLHLFDQAAYHVWGGDDFFQHGPCWSVPGRAPKPTQIVKMLFSSWSVLGRAPKPTQIVKLLFSRMDGAGLLNAPLTVFAGDDFLQAGYDFPSSATQQEFINLLFFSIIFARWKMLKINRQFATLYAFANPIFDFHWKF